MASVSKIPLFFVFLLLAYPVLSADSPLSPPSLAPKPPADGIPPSSAPSPAPSFSFPPAPPLPDLTPNSPSPAPSPQDDNPAHTKSPSPAPASAGDVTHENEPNAGDLDTVEESSGGMSAGQKAGVAIGVIAGACIVGAGAFVYKKRQQNIQRAQFGYDARREIL
ncbi:UNVERIFIED_CONTAM: hypothetical protein Sradi_0397300 [Sesamum radiatum]|uniref:Uncharacterized protein n=1 Tax=Sesamum radiatum TaxID=300843 RepID=A0AAW2W5A3_SESRA